MKHSLVVMIFAISIPQIFEAESLFDVSSWVRVRINLFQECHHEKQFFVFLLPHVSFNGDAVVQLVSEGDDRVVHNNDIFDVSVTYYSQVFHVNTIDWIHTMLPVKSMLDDLAIRVNVI
jgi:hypothetical protein